MKFKMSLMDKFIQELGCIKETPVFLGVARVLKVRAFSDGGAPRAFVDVFSDMLDAFDKEDKKRQKEILVLLRKANECGEEKDANSTEDTAE
jgi:hypothetical protein